MKESVETGSGIQEATGISQERKGEIALAVLKYILSQEGIKIHRHTQRRIGQVAKEINVDPIELTKFYELVVEEMLDEHLRPPR